MSQAFDQSIYRLDVMWLAVPLHLGLTTPIALCILIAIRRFGVRSHAWAS